jgi:6-phosphofructokinase 1
MDAHDRLFVIEVMGRDSGYIALHSGIATGAENILIPEKVTDIEAILTALMEKERRQKLVNLIIVAEGKFGGATEVAKIIRERLPQQEVRVCILGHIQRGGSPSCFDRLIASRMGYAAVECLQEGKHNVFVGILNNRLHYTPLDEAVKKKQRISEEWMKIVKILSS